MNSIPNTNISSTVMFPVSTNNVTTISQKGGLHHHHHSGLLQKQRHSSSVDQHQIYGLYDLENTIGQGHFAIVKRARHVFTGERVAVKVIDKLKLDQISREHLFQEVKCMKLVQHKNVVRLYEVIDTNTKLYLILELGDGGDMYDYIMKFNNGLCELKARKYFEQILCAIKYCHDLHVVHRDLKPENVVFFEKTGQVKLTDFGFSNIFQPGKKLNTSCGSLAYSAPEILLGDSYDAPAVDVWSLGVILYMLVTGHAPFQEANDSETLTMILDCKYYLPQSLSIECQDLIKRMLLHDPEKRILLDDIANHDWLNLHHHNDEDKTDEEDESGQNEPLIKFNNLSSNEHNSIIDNMVNGNIATKDEITKSLEEDQYNYITATYYLLAEKLLKRNLNQKNQKLKKKQRNQASEENDVFEVLDSKSSSHLKKNGAEDADIDEFICESDLTTNDSGLTNRRRDLLPFAIPEEVEESNLVDNTALNRQSSNSQSIKSNHMRQSPHLLKEINEEEESDKEQSGFSEDNIKNDQKNPSKKKSITRMPSPSGGESSNTDTSDQEINKNQFIETNKKNKKKRSKHQSRLRPSSISETSSLDEQHIQYKGNRAKSVETSTNTTNDLAPPLNYNLKSLSVEHRLANTSQMSICSTLSKTNSIKYNNINKANGFSGSDTPIHIHSTTPTPRESVVFNRGDEKPFAKIFQQKPGPNCNPSVDSNLQKHSVQATEILQGYMNYENDDPDEEDYENTLKSNKTILLNYNSPKANQNVNEPKQISLNNSLNSQQQYINLRSNNRKDSYKNFKTLLNKNQNVTKPCNKKNSCCSVL